MSVVLTRSALRREKKIPHSINSFDWIVLSLILVNLLFLRFVNVFYVAWYPVDFAIAAYIGVKLLHHKFKISLYLYISIILSAVVIGYNVISFGYARIAVDNVLMAYMPATFILFIYYLSKAYSHQQLENLLFQIKRILNWFFVINTPIIVIQIMTGTFLMGRFLAINSDMPWDHLCGLLGLNGVSVLNYVWIATVLANMYHFVVKRSPITLALIGGQLVIMTVISTYNDNKMFLLTMAVFFIAFMGFLIMRNNFSAKSIIIFAILFTIGLTVFQSVSSYMDQKTGTTNGSAVLDQFIYNADKAPDKYNERAYLNFLAFHIYDAKNQGLGLKNVTLYRQNIHEHLGINSSSLLLIMGGIGFLATTINFYVALLMVMFGHQNLLKRFLSWLVLAVCITATAYASQIFRDHYLNIALMLSFFIFYMTSIRKIEPIQKLKRKSKDRTDPSVLKAKKLMLRVNKT